MGLPMTVIRVLGNIISRASMSQMLTEGSTGTRDYYSVFGYKRTLTYDDLLQKYMRQGLASRIVEAPAQALWDNPPTITSNNAQWDDAWNRAVSHNALWKALLAVDKLAGLGSYSCLLIGASRNARIEAPARGAKSNNDLNDILYLQPYSQPSAPIDSLDQDALSKHYMLPETYNINPYKSHDMSDVLMPSGSVTSFKAHRSRILHVAENSLENSLIGNPRLQRVYNDLDDMLKVSGGTAETYWLTSNRGMQVDIDKDMQLTPEDIEDLGEELDEYANQMRRIIRTRGVTINSLGAEVPSPEETFSMLISLISGATGIPRRILIGAEAGQLASEQDRANWAEKVAARRKEFAEPVVLLPLFERLTGLGVLPTVEKLDINIVWPDSFVLNPLEKAQKAAQHARSATNFAKALETSKKMSEGTPEVPPTQDAEGKDVPGTGTPAVPGDDTEALVSAEEARHMMGLDPQVPTITNAQN